MIGAGPFGYAHVNAADQRRDPQSLLNWTERLIRMRKEVPEIGWGDFDLLETQNPAVLAIRYDWRNNSALFVHNFSSKPTDVRFAAGREGEQDSLLVNLLSEDHSRPDPDGLHRLTLEPYGYRWFRVGGLDYLLRRTEA